MKKILITLLSFVLCGQLFAQTSLPGQCSVWLPRVLDSEVIKKTDADALLRSSTYGQSPAPARKHYWVVFSDRENNKTYKGPNTNSGQYSTLSFNERLIIATISNGFALVYSEPKTERYPLISSAARSRGWVPMKNLLLWTKGLSDETYISYKAVICANINVGASESEGNLYHSPNSSVSKGKLSTNMHFYFIMKKVGTKVLLGQFASMPTGTNTGLYGWVDENSFVSWNHRTCLEPTWDRSSVEWFANNGKKWQVFGSKDKTSGTALAQQNYPKTKKPADPVFSTEYIYRTMPAQRLRYPLLDGSTSTQYHVTSFGTLGKTSSLPSDATIDEDHRIAFSNIEETKKIRIGILIDGTASMKNYFTSVQKAILEGVKYFDPNKVQVAVAIYRDKEDGQYVFESYPSAGGFTRHDNPGLKTFLQNAGKYGAKSADNDAKEALYYGMKKAVETLGFNKNQSNILLVVGDCGDNGKMGVTQDDIIELLAEKNVSLMAFQVRNRTQDSFQSFNYQLTYIMRKSLQKRFQKKAAVGRSVTEALVVGKELTKGWDVYNEKKPASATDIYRYLHRRTGVNQEMNIDELARLMEGTIAEWNKLITNLQELAAKDLSSGWEVNNNGDGTLTDEIIAICGSRERYERIKRANSLVGFRGYTLKKEPTSGRDYWKTVVFFPENELRALLIKLEPVYAVARNRSNDRRPYIEAMTKLASTLMAQDLSGTNVKNLPYKKIIAKVFGLSDSHTSLGGPSLEDVGDPNVVSHQEYLNYCNKMSTCISRLRKITGNKYSYIYTVSSGRTTQNYYWLPSEELPLY